MLLVGLITAIVVILLLFLFKPKSIDESQIKTFIHDGHIEQAKKKLQKALAHKDNPEYHFFLALVYEAEFNFEHAILEYEIILKMKTFTKNATFKNVVSGLVEDYKKINKIPDAIALLEQENTKNKTDLVDYWLCHLYNLTKQTAKSQILVETLLQKHPNDSKVLTEKGIIEWENGNRQKALDTFLKATTLDNKNYYAFYYLGLLQMSKNLLDKAILAFERAKNCSALKLSSLENIGDAYKQKDMIKNATDVYEIAVSEWENNLFFQETTSQNKILEIRYKLADCYLIDKNYQAALDQWRIIQSLNPNYKDVQALIQSNARFGKDRIQDFLITSDADFKKIITFSVGYLKIPYTHIAFIDKEIIEVSGTHSVLLWAVRSGNPAGEKIVRNFYQVMTEHKIKQGIILSANGFSPNGIRASLGKPIKLLGKGPMLKILKAYENRS